MAKLSVERKKLLQPHYANAIPLDLLKSELARITSEEASAQAILRSCELRFDKIKRNVEDALTLVGDCHRAYVQAPERSEDPSTRRPSSESG